MNTMARLVFILFIFNVTACTWVDLTEQGEKVRVLSAEEVTRCELLGQTTSNTTEKLVGIKRHDNALEYELTSLARNSASNMGGDTIVPVTGIIDGKQTFEIYRCIP